MGLPSESDSTRPVGRPPVAVERREQIFDAVEQCLLELGLSGTTLEAIAQRAGMTRSAIAYFVGNRDDVIDAAVARSVGRFISSMRRAVEDVPPQKQLERFTGFVLESDRERTGMITVMDEVIAYAHHDAHANEQLRIAYDDLQRFVEHIVTRRFPSTGAGRIAAVATGLILLLREFDRVRSLSATAHPVKLRRRTEDAVQILISSLEDR